MTAKNNINLVKKIISKNRYHRDGKKTKKKHITIHNNGNPRSTARGEWSWLKNKDNKRSYGFHYVHDNKETIQCIPDNERSYHAGDGANGEGNMYSISHEICELWSSTNYLTPNYKKAEERAIEFIAKQIVDYGWADDWDKKQLDGSLKRLKRHQDWSGKYCPRLIIPRWESFVSRIKVYVDKFSGNENADLSQFSNDDLLKELKKRLK